MGYKDGWFVARLLYCRRQQCIVASAGTLIICDQTSIRPWRIKHLDKSIYVLKGT